MTAKRPIADLIRQEVLAMSAYKVADARGLIKLDAMENPYSWPEALIPAWLEAVKACELNRYPDPEALDLAALIKRQNGLTDQQPILLGNGSDEIIQILLMALPPNASVLSVKPSFVMYRQISQSLGLNYREVPLLAESFELDLPSLLESIREHQPHIVFLAYPNNPTGNLFDPSVIAQVVAATEGLVVIDEAYAPFADASYIREISETGNLLVMRTVSKLGLAGIRLGYLAGPSCILEQLNKIRLPYNINVLTQATARFALTHQSVFDEQTGKIREERCRVFESLANIPGIKPYPSAANFILFNAGQGRADDIFNAIKSQGVLIKNMSGQGGLLRDCLRVTIGTPEENNAFLSALENGLKSFG